MKTLSVLILLFTIPLAFATEQISGAYQYTTPKPFDFITTAPKNYGDVLEKNFNKDSLKYWGLVLGSSGVLYVFDQKIFNETQRFGKRIGLDTTDQSRESLFIGDEGLLYAPTDLSSSIIFLGDGWTGLGLSAGFLTAGFIKDSPKEKMVASEIAQGLIFSGVSSQALKRIVGREIPNAQTSERGKFHPFASPRDFSDNKAHYDSFPSAHITTFMTTFTIIAENYEDVRWVRPLGYSLLGLLGFELVNCGSHWASDFPLALAIGHVSGKMIVQNGRKSSKNTSQINFAPLIHQGGIKGAQIALGF